MGTNDDTNGTDTTSIRPVSSLRSRFEHLGTPEAGPSTPQHTPSRLSQHFTASNDRPVRASLDQPRHLLGSINRNQEQERGKDNDNGTLRPRQRDGPRPARPVSMGPTSPPTTPALMIQSPQSPPKPAFPINVRTLGQSPPRPKSMGTGTRPSVPPLTTAVQHAQLTGQSSPTTLGKRSKPPPPVNRANKPVLPSSPSSLAPQNFRFDDSSVSPFSTPPDSPTSPESPPYKGNPTQIPIQTQAQLRRQPFPAPVLHPSTSASPSRPVETSDEPEDRPDLPARGAQREHARTISTPPIRVFTERGTASLQHTQSVLSSGPRTSRIQHSQSVRTPSRSREPPPRPSEASKEGRNFSSPQAFLPPPKRVAAVNGSTAYAASPKPPPSPFPDALASSGSQVRHVSPSQQQIRRAGHDGLEKSAMAGEDPLLATTDYPDAAQVNRRPPRTKFGVDHIWTHYDTRLFDLCGSRVCSTGFVTKAWTIENGKPSSTDFALAEREGKFLSIAFKPGATHNDEGRMIWLGSNQGEIVEWDLQQGQVRNRRPGAHGRHDIIKLYRFQNSMWSLDNDGRLFVWLPDRNGLPSLDVSPESHRVAKGHTFSVIARDKLWLATGREIRVYDPVDGYEQNFQVTPQPLFQSGTGDISAGAVLPSQLDRVYFGHHDGKITVYSTDDYSCQQVVSLVNQQKITAMAGVGHHLWAAFGTGFIYVYDTKCSPWKVKKEWKAHEGPVASITVDRSSVWKFGHLQVASIGTDNCIKFWDGMLEDDWAEAHMQEHDVEYCQFREIKAVVVTWNAGASTPGDIRREQRDMRFFREVIQPHDPPEILAFGFQELVDLEDKSLTAKNLFKGRHKKQSHDPEHMGHQYRAWRDYLTRLIDEVMPSNESYSLLQTGSLVGLFSCIFTKTSERSRIRDLEATEVKRGMGGLYGNKGAIIIRFVLDSTSLCFTNCHLAAGQKESNARNTDATAILEASALGIVRSPDHRINCYTGGGDGTMILDHEICILNGDLNYRIDTMGRDSVVKTIKAGNLDRLLERDQLLISRRRHPGLKLWKFREEKITFDPTYKYDVGTDNYDSSEKNRSPAWCDRVLYRGQGRIKMLEYRRHDCRASDHRPVSGTFAMRIKNVLPDKREQTWERAREEMAGMRMRVAEETGLDYLVNVLGLSPQEAKRKLHQ